MALNRLRLKSFKNYFQIWAKSFSTISLNSVPGLKAYNSLSKSKLPVSTKHPGVLSWYICGPTVYDFSHIGHAWCYVNFDIMRRVMEHYFDLNVIQVMNITDIDDKIIKRATEQNLNFKEVASKYEIAFLEDLDSLSVQRPTVLTKVSDYIPQIITFIERLLQQNLAYKTNDGSVYFNIEAYSKKYKYGKLKPFQATSTNADNSNPNDFALWKGAKSSLEPSWIPSWGGKGRPGWHIECSAMASYIFGSWVDIHSGGIDLLFPHHENEEAQCCAYHGNPQWVGHWIHANLLNLPDGEKMSKSLNNVLTIREFLQSNSADEFRMMCTISSYRKGMEYSVASLKLAKDLLDIIRIFIIDCRSYIRKSHTNSHSSIDPNILLTALAETKKVVKEHLGDDFNTAQATSAVQKLVQLTQKELRNADTLNQSLNHHIMANHHGGIEAVSSVLNFVSKYFSTLGFNTIGNSTKSAETDASLIIDEFVEFRSKIRQHALSIKSNKDRKEKEPELMNTKKILLTACDTLREDLKLRGIQLKDQEKNTTWTLAR